jgi:hypothetical protein
VASVFFEGIVLSTSVLHSPHCGALEAQEFRSNRYRLAFFDAWRLVLPELRGSKSVFGWLVAVKRCAETLIPARLEAGQSWT